MFGFKRSKLTFAQEAASFLFEHSPDAYYILENGRIGECNTAFLALMNSPRERLVGISPADISPEQQANGRSSREVVGENSKIVASQGHHRFDWIIKRLDGTLIPVVVTLLRANVGGRVAEIVELQDARETQALRQAEQASRDERVALMATQTRVTDRLGKALKSLSSGDLAHRIDEPFAAAHEELRTDFNTAATKLRETIQDVVAAADAIRSGTGEIAGASEDLARRTEQQAASLEQTAAALDEITATVKKTAEGAGHARAVVDTARSDAQRSGEIVGQAVAAMEGIEQSSHQISQIIGVIDEIAFQTNLLALNAGVEAARAGEAGRGFAVVASEVRALAQRSAEAAKEIKSLISTSSNKVSEGVSLVAETGKALGRIMTQVVEVNSVVTAIASSTKEQAQALAEVNMAINEMDKVTQQNAAMVEETTAAARNLSGEANNLDLMIGRFQTGTTAPAKHAAPSRPARPATARPGPKVSSATGASAALRKPAPETETWEEF